MTADWSDSCLIHLRRLAFFVHIHLTRREWRGTLDGEMVSSTNSHKLLFYSTILSLQKNIYLIM